MVLTGRNIPASRPLRPIRSTATLYSTASSTNLRMIHTTACFIVRRAPTPELYAALRLGDPTPDQIAHLNSLFAAAAHMRTRKRQAAHHGWALYDSFEAETVIQRLTEFLTGTAWRSAFANLKNGEELRLRAADRHSDHVMLLGLMDFNRTTGVYAYDTEGAVVRYYTRNATGGINTAYGHPADEIVDGIVTEEDVEGVAEAMEEIDMETLEAITARSSSR